MQIHVTCSAKLFCLRAEAAEERPCAVFCFVLVLGLAGAAL